MPKLQINPHSTFKAFSQIPISIPSNNYFLGEKKIIFSTFNEKSPSQQSMHAFLFDQHLSSITSPAS
jgi:hypothetical protein